MPDFHTVGSVIRQLLPSGSDANRNSQSGTRRSWTVCPEWPADVFAIAATLVERSDCYTCIGAEIGSSDGLKKQREWNEEARALGQEWSETLGVPDKVDKIWRDMMQHQKEILHHRNSPTKKQYSNPQRLLPWECLALRLLAIADEAGRGFGWAYPGRPEVSGAAAGVTEKETKVVNHDDNADRWVASRFSSTAARGCDSTLWGVL